MTLRVTVQPNAPENQVVGFHGEALKVKVTAPPKEGKANQKLIEVLAERLGVKRSNIEIIRGQTSRNKVLRIWNVNPNAVRRALKTHL
ncbi:MAG: YggU family protein [Anaerolineales bacterium]|nr:YggU family protein [Deltaproteobacteria bacterium]NIS83184.1 YggU family protein [Anaerolineales bacterium]